MYPDSKVVFHGHLWESTTTNTSSHRLYGREERYCLVELPRL